MYTIAALKDGFRLAGISVDCDAVFIDDLLVDIEEDGGATAIFPNQNDFIIQIRLEIKEIIENL